MSLVSDLFNQTITVRRPTYIDDGIGGKTAGTPTTHTIKGYISLRNGVAKERAKAGKREVEITHDLFCDENQDIKAGDELDFGGTQYFVVAVRPVYDAETGTVDHQMAELSQYQG